MGKRRRSLEARFGAHLSAAPPPRIGTLVFLQGWVTQGEWEPRDIPEAQPRPVEDTWLITRFDAKHNHCRSFVYTQYKLGGEGGEVNCNL